MKKRTIILSTAAVGIVAAAFGVAGAALATTSPKPVDVPEGFVATQSEFEAEYSGALGGLDLPASGARAAQVAEVPELEPNVIAEEGVAAGIAHHEWLCAWEAEYLSAFGAGDVARATSALDVIQSWETLPWVKEHVVDPERGWYSSVVAPALKGDPSGVEEDHAFGCGD